MGTKYFYHMWSTLYVVMILLVIIFLVGGRNLGYDIKIVAENRNVVMVVGAS